MWNEYDKDGKIISSYSFGGVENKMTLVRFFSAYARVSTKSDGTIVNETINNKRQIYEIHEKTISGIESIKKYITEGQFGLFNDFITPITCTNACN